MTDSAAVAAAYDARADEYIAVAGTVAQMADVDRVLIREWRDSTSDALLDAGCGPGHWAAELYVAGRTVIGVDLSERFLAHARAAHPDVEFRRASVLDLPFADGSFGGLLAWYSLIHLAPADLEAACSELARVLRPGGTILLGYFDGAAGESFPHAITMAYQWNGDVLGAVLERAGLRVVSAQRRDREPGEVSRRAHGALVAVRV